VVNGPRPAGSRDEQRTYAGGSSAFVLPLCPPAASPIEQVIDLGELLQQPKARLCLWC